MNKITNASKYFDMVRNNSDFFRNYYFHSIIDLNLAKADSIIHNGILSKRLIEEKELPSLYTHDSRDYDSKNGDSYISLTEYTDDCSFNEMFESFPLHTLTCLSFLISKDICTKNEGERESYFFDEVFCHDQILPKDIMGIMLPEHLSNLPISKVNCLPNDLSCYTKTYIKNWIICMQKYFGRNFSKEELEEIILSQEQLWNILKEYECPERWVQSAITKQSKMYGKDFKDVLASVLESLWEEKFNKSNPTYLEVLLRINENKVPIYEAKQKCLKRIV